MRRTACFCNAETRRGWGTSLAWSSCVVDGDDTGNFLPDERMATELLEARGRGVKVVVLVPGAIDHNLVRQASRASFGRMLKAGIEIHEYRAGLLHAKTMIVDGVWATIGSTNLVPVRDLL